ncbi:MAG: leucine-rich repeat protein [Clostridium sp.]|nr:leucine-rich repeat protein [Clostridium sp.]
MKNKKNIAKGIVVATALANMPVDSLASTIEEYNMQNIDKNTKENNIRDGIKKFFAKIVEPIEDLASKPKEVIKVNKNIVRGSVLQINLDDNDFVQDLSGNPDGYETVKVITSGSKKLVKEDYDKLRLSGIPKVDLSDAWSDSIPVGAFSSATHLTEFKFPQGIKSISLGASSYTQGSFYNCKNLTGSLNIPNSVTSIGSHAFRDCSGFAGSLTIPESVTNIGTSAFNGCSGFIGSLTIPESVTNIGTSAFNGCSGFIGSLTIPESVTNIGISAFYGCRGFTGSLTIPNSVTTIGDSAFRECSGFTGSLTIPSSVTTIGNDAFYGCSGFTGELIIPNSITSIGNSAFRDCSGFTGSLAIPNSVTSIESFAFNRCSGFTGSLTIGDSVVTIGDSAFNNCSGFTGDLIIPDSVTTIGDGAFSGCSGFTGSLAIPNSVTSIESFAFQYCSGFTGNLVIPDSLTSIESFTFRGCNGFDGNLVIPDSVTSIGQEAFEECSKLSGNLVMPDSVTSIGEEAFFRCNGFTGDLIIPDSVTSIGERAFSTGSNIDNIIVKTDEIYVDTNYRKDVIEKLPIDKTYIEMSYNFDTSGTWLQSTNYIKAQPKISTYAGNFENNEGMGISLKVIEASPIKTITVTKDGLNCNLEKSENGDYVFNENGNYQIYIETQLGTISNIEFKNISPINTPDINIIDNNLNIINNGILSNAYLEEFDNTNDLKFNFSNLNWIVENGTLKSETINHSSSTENEFIINAEAGEKLQISVKTSSENNYDWGYIYLNGSEVYKKSGTSNDFEVVELDLQEGENTIKFMYTKDSLGSSGSDSMFIDYIKILKNEITTIDCDTLEYRINGGEWQTYNGAFELNYTAGTKVQVDVRASHDGFTSAILSQEVTVELNTQEIEEAVEKAEQSRKPIDISTARDLVNQMPESTKKDVFQGRLDSIFPSITLEKENASANMDIYIKSENMLSLSLNTNVITFENFNGTEDLEKPNAVELTVNSSLPYDVNAYLATKIENANKNKELDKDLLKIKANGTTNYKSFTDINTATTLLPDEQSGNHKKHSIDLKLEGNDAVETDVYKTTIKFEVTQK